MGVVGLDVGLHRGASPDHAAEPLQLIGDELIAGRILQRQELQEEAMSLGRPVLAPVAAAGLRCEAGALAEQSSPQLVEPGAAHPQMRGGSGGVERPRVEVVEDAADKSDGMAVGQLLVFIAGTLSARRIGGNASTGPQPRRRPPARLRPSKSTFAPSQSGFVPSLSGFAPAPTRYFLADFRAPFSRRPLWRALPPVAPDFGVMSHHFCASAGVTSSR